MFAKSEWLSRCKSWLIPALFALVGLVLGMLFMTPSTDVVCGAIGATYEVEGLPLAMMDGQNLYRLSEEDQMAVLTYLDRVPVRGKLAGQVECAAITMTQLPGGGSGVYTYVAAAVPRGRRVEGTNAVLLGDRIAVLDVTIEDECIWVSMLTHEEGQSPDSAPTVSETRQFYLRDGELVQIP